jgi:thiosulfate/3-mercaptopyruvate sulfurtransferase
MLTRLAGALALVLLLAMAPLSAHAADPLVTVDWLKANLGKPGMVILDVRSGAGVSKEAWLRGHIPGAIFTDYAKAGWRETNPEGVESQLPPPAKLEAVIGRHGIDNETHVVIVPEGRAAQDVAAATRIYWTLKYLGHDAVSILDGGHVAWIAQVDKDKKPVNPLETADVVPQPKTFKAKPRPEMLVSREEVRQAIAASTPLIDNRPHDFHVGLTKSPAAKRAGTLPNAQSVPEGWLTQNGGGKFRSKDQLAKIYANQSVPIAGDQINFCNTGHWASLGWFVSAELLGNKQARMYAGSLAEWTQDANAPVVKKVQID